MVTKVTVLQRKSPSLEATPHCNLVTFVTFLTDAELLLLAFARSVIFRGGFEGFLQPDHIFARTENVESF